MKIRSQTGGLQHVLLTRSGCKIFRYDQVSGHRYLGKIIWYPGKLMHALKHRRGKRMEFIWKKKRFWQLHDVSCICNNKAFSGEHRAPPFVAINPNPKLSQCCQPRVITWAYFFSTTPSILIFLAYNTPAYIVPWHLDLYLTYIPLHPQSTRASLDTMKRQVLASLSFHIA